MAVTVVAMEAVRLPQGNRPPTRNSLRVLTDKTTRQPLHRAGTDPPTGKLHRADMVHQGMRVMARASTAKVPCQCGPRCRSPEPKSLLMRKHNPVVHDPAVPDTGKLLLGSLQSIRLEMVLPANMGLLQGLSRCPVVMVPLANLEWHPANPVSSVLAAKVELAEPAEQLVVKAVLVGLAEMPDRRLPRKPLAWCLKFRMTHRSIRLSS